MTRWTHDEVRELYKRIEENAALALKEKERADKAEEMLKTTGMYVPAVGDVIVLTEDWNFKLYEEDRNKDCLELINVLPDQYHYFSYGSEKRGHDFVVPAHEELIVDRVYVRKGFGADFNSLTFRWKRSSVDSKGKVVRKVVRFWAKLEDVNNIRFTRKDK